MKIVLIGGQCIPGIGGIESYVLNMAKSLTKQGDDVTIICCDRKAYTKVIDGIEIVHMVCPRSNIIALPLLFIKALPYIIKNRKHIDVINYQSIFFAFISGWIAKLCGCNVYYTIHSLAEDNPKHSKIMKFLMKATAYMSTNWHMRWDSVTATRFLHSTITFPQISVCCRPTLHVRLLTRRQFSGTETSSIYI